MALHFNISRDDLIQAVGAQQNITSKKGTLAILANVLIEAEQDRVIVTGTDLEIGLRKTVAAEIFETGILTLPSKKLFEIARESDSPMISFQEEENNWVTINAGSSQYKLAGMMSDEFPKFPEYDAEKMVEIDAAVFSDLIDKTIFSIAQDKESMYSLTAALFKKEEKGEKRFLQFITSDGHRLTIMNKEVDRKVDNLQFNPTTLIPRRGVQEIRKFCEDKDSFLFGLEKKQAVLKSEDALLIVRLMQGEFPDFQSIIKVISRDNLVAINRIRFLEALKRINLFTEDMFKAIKIEISEDHMVLTSRNADFGSARDEFAVVYAGEPLSLGFNCRYFIDTLQVMEGENIKAYISSDESPCLIESDDDDGFLSIIMPMKL
ncbi:MAG TPA: DNA polymerase III subunit beta [Desulfobacteraceae bacterium]|nr:DNA polymerase III subunit beta [Desulfobacteraceae bacterium]